MDRYPSLRTLTFPNRGISLGGKSYFLDNGQYNPPSRTYGARLLQNRLPTAARWANLASRLRRCSYDQRADFSARVFLLVEHSGGLILGPGGYFQAEFCASNFSLMPIFWIAFSSSFAYYTLFVLGQRHAIEPVFQDMNTNQNNSATDQRSLVALSARHCIFPGGESDMTLCRSTSKRRQNHR